MIAKPKISTYGSTYGSYKGNDLTSYGRHADSQSTRRGERFKRRIGLDQPVSDQAAHQLRRECITQFTQRFWGELLDEELNQ